MTSAFRAEVDEGAWTCRHLDPAPATELNVAQLVDGRLRCQDCGTEWRVWPELRVAAASIDWSPTHLRGRFQRAPRLEVDDLFERVRERLPLVTIRQARCSWPEDDDAQWCFHGPANVVQLEASNGSRPFTLTDARLSQHTVVDVDAATDLLVSLLQEQPLSIDKFFQGRQVGAHVHSYMAGHGVVTICIHRERGPHPWLVVNCVEECFIKPDRSRGEILVRRSGELLELSGPGFRLVGRNAVIRVEGTTVATDFAAQGVPGDGGVLVFPP